MSALCDETGTLRAPAAVLIVRLEYLSVREDGMLPSGAFIEVDGMYRVSTAEDGFDVDGCEFGATCWALYLFPRDAFGNVVGWFMLFTDPGALADALHGISIAGIPMLH